MMGVGMTLPPQYRHSKWSRTKMRPCVARESPGRCGITRGGVGDGLQGASTGRDPAGQKLVDGVLDVIWIVVALGAHPGEDTGTELVAIANSALMRRPFDGLANQVGGKLAEFPTVRSNLASVSRNRAASPDSASDSAIESTSA
jgi:hypothetical protein